TTALTAGDIVAGAGTNLANYVLPTTATGIGTITPRTLTAAIVGMPTKMADGTTTVALASGAVVLGGFVAGQQATVLQTVGSFDGVTAGDHVVTATLGAGVLAANANTLLANYTIPATASGAGLVTPAVLTNTGSLYAAIASNLAVRHLADAGGIAALAQRAVLGATLGRTYIPYPAPSALSTWQTNGFAPLPSIVTLSAPDTTDDLATRSPAPIINSTQQILLQGGTDKAWRIVLPPLPGSAPVVATTRSEHAR
ncbi:MAG: YDG domain-containing protein, partial [Janthinobacterium lividum]